MKRLDRPWESDPQFDDFPHHRDFLSAIHIAVLAQQKQVNAALANQHLTQGQVLAVLANALIGFRRAFLIAEANLKAAQGLEYEDPEIKLRREVLEVYDAAHDPNSDRPLGLDRATLVQVAYQQGARLSEKGGIDGPMERAMQVAAVLEKIEEAGALGDYESMARMFRYYEDKAEELPTDAIRKSIQRYRVSIRGKDVMHFDREAFTWSAVDAEEAFLPNLPKGRGRPRRN